MGLLIAACNPGSGTRCGDAVCNDAEYCVDDLYQCGASPAASLHCATRGALCPAMSAPVCGCDGAVYDSACVAAVAGHDLSVLGACAAQPGQFRCGYRVCEGAQYCQRTTSDVGGTPDAYDCLTLPAACTGAIGCGCLSGVNCGDTCTASGAQLTVTCPGG
jgi:hypothetical protein